MDKPRIIRTVDIGGSGPRVADVIDGQLQSVWKKPVEGIEEFLEHLATDLLSHTMGISIVTTGVVEDNNLVTSSPNVSWLRGVKLGDVVKKRFPDLIGVQIYNDMEGACAGIPVVVPRLKGRPFWGITLSHGVAAKFVDENGHVVLPKAEWGHVFADDSLHAMRCSCGQTGCYETLLGGDSLRQKVLSNESRTSEIPDGVHPCDHLKNCYREGHSWAVDMYCAYAQVLSRLVSALINTSGGYSTIVFRGGVSRHVIPWLKKDIFPRLSVMDNKWLDNVEIHLVDLPEPDADSFLGAAKLLEDYLYG